MLTDALSPVSWRAKPRSFVALMALYESNFIRLGWLAGELQHLQGTHVSRVDGDCDLVLTVREQSPYTTTFDLTYLLPDTLSAPDMRLRVYHDAHLAEALEWAPLGHAHQGLSALRRSTLGEIDERWARNVMLNKWLEYCSDRGHRFVNAST